MMKSDRVFGWPARLLVQILVVTLVLPPSFTSTARATVNEDYPGLTVPARASVAIVPMPGGAFLNTYNANLSIDRLELFFPSEGIPLDHSLTHNTLLNMQDGPFGFGWSFSYGVWITVPAASQALVHWGDGRRDLFIDSGGGYQPVNEAVAMDMTSTGPGTFRICSPQRICYDFADPSHGKLTSITDPTGHRVTLDHAPGGQLTAVRDTHDFALRFHYNTEGRVAQVLDASLSPTRTWSYSYDALGNLIRVQNPRGHTTHYAYACPHLLTRITSPLGLVTDIGYSPAAQVVEVANQHERTTITYGIPLRRTSVSEWVDTMRPRTTLYDYDAGGRLVQLVDALGGTWLHTYDALGYPASMQKPTGAVTTYQYDARGNLLRQTDPYGHASIWTYDPFFSKTASFTDALGHTTSYAHDMEGHLTRVTDPMGHQANLAYGPGGRLVTFTDRRGNTTSYDHDVWGNLTTMLFPAGLGSLHSEYDPAHRRVREHASGAAATSTEFDAADHAIRVIDRNGSVWESERDALESVTRFTDPAGASSSYDYDEAGRLRTITVPGGGQTQYEYDGLSRLVRITEPGHFSPSFTLQFDDLDRMSALTDALGRATTLAHDPNGNVVSQTKASGKHMTATYDLADRATSVTDFSTGESSLLVYDDAGNLTRASNPHADLALSYDGLGRLTQVSDLTAGRSIQHVYDPNGNPASMTTPEGGTFSYEYDARDRMSRLVDPAGRTTHFSYDASSLLTQLVHPNGVSSEYGYDAAGQLASIDTRRSGGATVYHAGYERDAAGAIVRMNDQGTIKTYTYAPEGRLSRLASSTGRTIDYEYAPDGDRTRVVDSLAGTTTLSYDAAHQLLASSGSEPASYGYDADGNRASRTDAAGTVAYQYDAASRLSHVDFPGGSRSYTYDALGRRVRATDGLAQSISYLRDLKDGGNVVAEYDQNGIKLAGYTSLPAEDTYLAIEAGGATTDLHSDHLGSVRAGTNAAQATTATRTYGPFGSVEAATGSIGDRAFTGADAGATPDLVHLRAREYDTRTGRFLQRDPLAGVLVDPANLNPYVYASSDPVNHTDPQGKLIWFVVGVVVFAVGVVAGIGGAKFVSGLVENTKDAGESYGKALDASLKGDGRGADRYQGRFKEKFQDVLDKYTTILKSTPGTSLTGPLVGGAKSIEQAARILTLKLLKEGTEEEIEEFLKKDAKPKRPPANTGHRKQQKMPFTQDHKPRPKHEEMGAGGTAVYLAGANSPDGDESHVRYAQGATRVRDCGKVYASVTVPGPGRFYGVDVDPSDGTLWLAGEGAGEAGNLMHLQPDGTVISRCTIPVLAGGARGVTATEQGLYLTEPTGPVTGTILLGEGSCEAPLARWAFSGPDNPNGDVQIAGASDLEILPGRVGPNGGAVALVVSSSQTSVWEVELMTDQTPPLSSGWSILSQRTNPAGRPSMGLDLTPGGLLTTFLSQQSLQDPLTLAVIDDCPRPLGPGAWGGSGGGGNGGGPGGGGPKSWGIHPLSGTLLNMGAPGGAPAPDGDGDGLPDPCDLCASVPSPDDLDSDGDGYGDLCECDPQDPSRNPSAQEICGDGIDNDCDQMPDGADPACAGALEVQNLHVSPTAPAFTWSPLPGAQGYDLIRGEIQNLRPAGGTVDLGPVSCVELASADARTEIDPAIPLSGRAYYYLVRAHAALAPYGSSSSGAPRAAGPGECPATP